MELITNLKRNVVTRVPLARPALITSTGKGVVGFVIREKNVYGQMSTDKIFYNIRVTMPGNCMKKTCINKLNEMMVKFD